MKVRGSFSKTTLIVSLALTTFSVQAKELTLALPISIPWRDPIDLNLLEEWEVYAGVYDSLLQYDANEGFTGILAERWSFDAKTKTFTFKIREGAKFSDGSPLTSDDVAYSFRRILFLDRDHSQILTRCLSGPSVTLKSPTDPHPSIRAVDSTTLVLGPVQCGETLLNELSNANYGVISRRSLDSNFKVTPKGPFSGLFVYSNSGGVTMLTKNIQNWRWQKHSAQSAVNSVKVIKFERDRFLSNDSLSADLLRISQPEVYERAKKLNYQLKLSLPIMTWFIAPSDKNKIGASEVQSSIQSINDDLDRSTLPYLSGNLLERPTNEFFPMALNCGSESASSAARPPRAKKKHPLRIEIVDHPSGEGTRLVTDVITSLRKAGYSVSELIPAGTESSKVPEGTVRLILRRQFLGDSLPNVFNMLFRVLKPIPDPLQKIVPQLTKLERLKKSEQAATLSRVCHEFYHYEHIPLAHRIFAFAASEPKLLDVFSKVTGNLLLEQIPKIGAEQ